MLCAVYMYDRYGIYMIGCWNLRRKFFFCYFLLFDLIFLVIFFKSYNNNNKNKAHTQYAFEKRCINEFSSHVFDIKHKRTTRKIIVECQNYVSLSLIFFLLFPTKTFAYCMLFNIRYTVCKKNQNYQIVFGLFDIPHSIFSRYTHILCALYINETT